MLFNRILGIFNMLKNLHWFLLGCHTSLIKPPQIQWLILHIIKITHQPITTNMERHDSLDWSVAVFTVFKSSYHKSSPMNYKCLSLIILKKYFWPRHWTWKYFVKNLMDWNRKHLTLWFALIFACDAMLQCS